MNIFKKDLIKECRLYASMLDFFDKVLDKKFKNLLYSIVKDLPFDFGKFVKFQHDNRNLNTEEFFYPESNLLLLCDKVIKIYILFKGDIFRFETLFLFNLYLSPVTIEKFY